jgi:hypothetical protein
MNEIIQRWRRAGERAHFEQVRIVEVGGELRATSTSRPLGSYLLSRTPEGWTCECPANREYGLPCKHLWALAELLQLDVLSDVRLNPDLLEQTAA